MTSADVETTTGLQMAALILTAALEKGSGEKCCVSLREFGQTRDFGPLYEYRIEMPGLAQMRGDLEQGRIKVDARVWTDKLQAVIRGLKRATARAYTANELLRNGGA